MLHSFTFFFCEICNVCMTYETKKNILFFYKKNGKASIKLRGTLQDFPKCGPGSLNCFTYPSNLTDGLYTKDNFTGDLFFTYENKTYKCKLEKPCQPIGFL